MHCLREYGLLEEANLSFFSGDPGFIGVGMIAPSRNRRPVIYWTGRMNLTPSARRSRPGCKTDVAIAMAKAYQTAENDRGPQAAHKHLPSE